MRNPEDLDVACSPIHIRCFAASAHFLTFNIKCIQMLLPILIPDLQSYTDANLDGYS